MVGQSIFLVLVCICQMDSGTCKPCSGWKTSVWSQIPNFTQELCQLRNLRTLRVWTDVFTKDLASSLCILGTGSLNSLTAGTNEESMNFVMEPWNPTPISLKRLEILGIQLPRIPRWIGSLDNLQHLGLNVDQLGPADVGLLGQS